MWISREESLGKQKTKNKFKKSTKNKNIKYSIHMWMQPLKFSPLILTIPLLHDYIHEQINKNMPENKSTTSRQQY